MSFWRLFYHIVWATRGRHPLIGEKEEAIIRRSLEATFNELDVIPHAVGMMPDHIHIAVSNPPKVSVADLVRRAKGASSHALNHADDRTTEPTFACQSEYGAVSFGEKALPDVINCINNQKERHAEKRLWPTLERLSEDKQPVETGLSH